MGHRKFTEEMVEFARANTEGKSVRELMQAVNARFGTSFTYDQIKAMKSRYHLPAGSSGQFQKGLVPWNKGKKITEWMDAEGIEHWKANYFHGDPHNTKPIGSIRQNLDGYMEIKVRHVAHDPRHNWIGLHRYVWEQEHGEIPKGMLVSFKDGDKTNCNIDNLILIDRRTAQAMMKNNLWSKHANLTEAGVAVAKVIVKSNERRKRGKEGDY